MKVTETEYETVERDVERWKCDHCGFVFDEDEINYVPIYDGDNQLASNKVDSQHLCDECTNVREALEVREQKATIRDRWEWFAEKFSNEPALLSLGLFIGSAVIWFAASVRIENAATAGVVGAELTAGLAFVVLFLVLYTMAVVFTIEGI